MVEHQAHCEGCGHERMYVIDLCLTSFVNRADTDTFLVEHPHGGGRGKSKGNRHPTSPWGTPVSSNADSGSFFWILTVFHHDRPREVSRRARRAMSTSMLSLLAFVTWVSREARGPAREEPVWCKITWCILYTVYRRFPVAMPPDSGSCAIGPEYLEWVDIRSDDQDSEMVQSG